MKSNANMKKQKRTHNNKNKKEKLTTQDIKYLMGVSTPRYHRVAIRVIK